MIFSSLEALARGRGFAFLAELGIDGAGGAGGNFSDLFGWGALSNCFTVGRRFSKFCAWLLGSGLSLKGIVERRDEFVNLRSK